MVDHREGAVQDENAGLGDDDTVSELRVPLHAAHVRHTQFVDNPFGAEVIHEKGVVGRYEDLAERSGENHIDFCQAFLHYGPLPRVGSVKA